MYSLERAVEQVSRWPSGKDKERARLAELADELIARCKEAKKVWEGYLASPGAPGTPSALMSWIGSARTRQLHEINLAARDVLLRLTAAVDNFGKGRPVPDFAPRGARELARFSLDLAPGLTSITFRKGLPCAEEPSRGSWARRWRWPRFACRSPVARKGRRSR